MMVRGQDHKLTNGTTIIVNLKDDGDYKSEEVGQVAPLEGGKTLIEIRECMKGGNQGT